MKTKSILALIGILMFHVPQIAYIGNCFVAVTVIDNGDGTQEFITKALVPLDETGILIVGIIGIIGFILIGISIFITKYRAKWFFWYSLILSALLLPIILGFIPLIYLFLREEEFRHKDHQTNLKTLWFSPNGRATRKDLWLRTLLPFYSIYMLSFILAACLGAITDSFYLEIAYGLASTFLLILVIWPWTVVFIKRAHDRNRSGWFILLCYIPIVNLWPAFELHFLKGTDDSNQFGDDPI